MPLTWHYVCRLFAATRRKEEMASSEGFPLMNFARFLAGLPCFSATEDLKGSACSGEHACQAEHPRAVGDALLVVPKREGQHVPLVDAEVLLRLVQQPSVDDVVPQVTQPQPHGLRPLRAALQKQRLHVIGEK